MWRYIKKTTEGQAHCSLSLLTIPSTYDLGPSSLSPYSLTCAFPSRVPPLALYLPLSHPRHVQPPGCVPRDPPVRLLEAHHPRQSTTPIDPIDIFPQFHQEQRPALDQVSFLSEVSVECRPEGRPQSSSGERCRGGPPRASVSLHSSQFVLSRGVSLRVASNEQTLLL